MANTIRRGHFNCEDSMKCPCLCFGCRSALPLFYNIWILSGFLIDFWWIDYGSLNKFDVCKDNQWFTTRNCGPLWWFGCNQRRSWHYWEMQEVLVPGVQSCDQNQPSLQASRKNVWEIFCRFLIVCVSVDPYICLSHVQKPFYCLTSKIRWIILRRIMNIENGKKFCILKKIRLITNDKGSAWFFSNYKILSYFQCS